jgi:DNA-binding transcriptional MerR regulator
MKPRANLLQGRNLLRQFIAGNGRGALFLLCLLTLSLACVPASYTNDTRASDDESSSTAAQGSFTGQWLVEFRTGEDKVQVSLRYESRGDHGHSYSNTGFRIAPDALQGLTREQAMSGGTHVQFQLKRDAGAFNCEGWFKDGNGSGHFVFSADPNFAAELKRQGYGSPSPEQQFSMALSDVSLAFIAELKAQGYERPTLDQLVDSGNHGVRLDYIQGLKSLGYNLRKIDDLIEMKDHGVSLNFIRDMSALGYERIPAEQLIMLKDHGVNPDLVSTLKTAGYAQLSLNQLVQMNDHGVNKKFISEIDALGYTRLPIEQLIEMKDHGVTANFIQALKGLGYERVSVDLLIRLRDHGVSTGFIQQMKSRGYNDLDQMIEKRDRGEEN